jgi:RecB family exonuclease
MSQLTFDDFLDGSASAKTSADKSATPKSINAVSPDAKKESWYKGRVLSHSSISLYKQCPQKWKFRYIDKIPEKPKSFFSFGKSVHAGLEFLFEKIGQVTAPSLEELLAYYKSGWLREGYETPEQEKWYFLEGDRILRGFYAKHATQVSQIIQVEFKFTIQVEGVPVTGYIDRIDATPRGNLHIVDYKTGKAFDKARVRSDPQLTLYQMACRELLQKEVDFVTLYHLNSLTPLTVPAHSQKLQDEVKTQVVSAAKGITAEKFDPKPDEKGHCQWCDYMQVCPAFQGKK